MKYERWLIPETDDAAVEALMDAGYPYLVSTVLASRDVVTPAQAAAHLARERSLVYSPYLMRDMDKAVARIDRALAGGENIAVFGDYDLDGITSTCLLTDYLRSRGAAVLMHIPRRIEEGYGLGCDAIRALAEQGVTLIVTVDCGITGVEETAFAATLGVDLVITDHHECKDELPAACAVVDPHRPDCGFPFKHLAGVGVALELVLALGGAERESALFSRYCTLAAIGTIADVMRMEGENRTIVQCGLEGIDRSDFTGLHALLREAGLTGRPVSSVQIGFVLAPRINAAGRMGRAELAAELLLTPAPAKAERLARELCDLNRERQSVEQNIFRCAIEQMDTLAPTERNALVLSSEEWHQGVVGIFRTPVHTLEEVKTGGRYLALERVQDPGNVGTLLRSAAAFGFDGVLLSDGCASVFAPKTLRASMGAAVRIPVIEAGKMPEAIALLREKGITCLAAALYQSQPLSAAASGYPDGGCAVIGSEGQGLTDETIAACTGTVRIPMTDRVESLNAGIAGSILLWHFREESL